MKKSLFIILILLCGTDISAQTYRLEHLYTDTSPYFYFSSWKSEDKDTPELFSLWSRMEYGDVINTSFNTYKKEEVYFKGDPQQTYHFLSDAIQFVQKYGEEDCVVGEIQGVRVMCDRKYERRKTLLIYNEDKSSFYSLREKKLSELLDKFIGYCNDHSIKYKDETSM